MAVIPTWSQFRYLFGIGGATSNQLYGQSAGTFTYAPGPPATISQGAGDFTADGHLADMRLDVINAPINSGRYTIASVQPLLITLSYNETLQAETVASVLASIYRDADEVESYPAEFHPIINLVRSGGFDTGFSGIPKPYDGTEIEVSINSGAADSAFGANEYHWYLKQKTDTLSKQYLSIRQKPSTFTESYSGTVLLQRTQLGIDEVGAGSITTQKIRELFSYCNLYVKRISDGAIQWIDLYRAQQQ